MKFHENEYLSWYIPRIHPPDGSINLHSSGVPALDAAEFPAQGGDPWTAVGRFEGGLAEWLGVPAEEILFTPGGTGGTLLALLTLAGRGERLAVEAPIYEPMLKQAARLGPVDRFVRRAEQEWKLPLEEAKATIIKDTSLVMITEPSNPSGRFSPRDDVLQLAEHAARHGAKLLVNEVYRGFSDRPSYHRAAENIIVVSSLSKLLGAYWARLGWLSADVQTISELRAAHLNMGMASSPAAAVGETVVAHADELRRQARRVSREGLEIMNAWVSQTPGVKWHESQGPGFGCLQLSGDWTDDRALAEHLHAEKGVLLVPGTFFEAPGTLRISWLQSGERLAEGLALVAEALSRK